MDMLGSLVKESLQFGVAEQQLPEFPILVHTKEITVTVERNQISNSGACLQHLFDGNAAAEVSISPEVKKKKKKKKRFKKHQ